VVEAVTNNNKDKKQQAVTVLPGERDKQGRFAKGNRIATELRDSTGIKVGRKKSIAGEVRDALRIAEDAMPEIIREMITRATDPTHRDSQRAGEYLIDRIYGKATQPIDSRSELKVTFEIGKGYIFNVEDEDNGDRDEAVPDQPEV
jgi:hypothetical protein